jgi:hypothetical protein
MFNPYDQYNQSLTYPNQPSYMQPSAGILDTSDQTQRMAALLRQGYDQPQQQGGSPIDYKTAKGLADWMSKDSTTNGNFSPSDVSGMSSAISPNFQTANPQFQQLTPQQAAITPSFANINSGVFTQPSSGGMFSNLFNFGG